jgi:hypothetical protein
MPSTERLKWFLRYCKKPLLIIGILLVLLFAAGVVLTYAADP